MRKRLLLIFAVLAAIVMVTACAELGDDDPRECNGSARLCDLRLDQVAFAGAHNAMNSAEGGFIYPDQGSDIAAQLDAGVRGFLIDAFLGTVRSARGADVVYTQLNSSALSRMVKTLTSSEAQEALRRRAQVGPPPAGEPQDVYLCHNFCELGAVLMSRVVETFRAFLDKNPDEVLFIVIQDELDARALTPELEVLDRYIATIDPTKELPTLESMVESGDRVVIGLEHGDLGPRLPNVYDDGLVQETPFNFASITALRLPTSCRPNRGSADAPMLLLNHWLSPGDEKTAATANAEDVLLTRARRCASARGQAVNLVAVDFFEEGDLRRVVRKLNREGGS